MATGRFQIVIRTPAGALVDPTTNPPVFSVYERRQADGTLVAGDAPTFTRRGTGRFEVLVTLEAGEYVDGIVVPDSPASTRPRELHVRYVDLVAAPTVDEIVDEIDTRHGDGPYGGAGGSGSQAVTLTVRDATTDGGLSGARVDVVDGAGQLLATGNTDSDGEVELLLDVGTYEARVTRGGYSFSATEIVVTATDTVTPATIDGTAVALATGGVTGLVRALSLAVGDAPNTDGVAGVVAGDHCVLTRSFTSLPSGRTIATVKSTWKREADALETDDGALQRDWTVSGVSASLTLTPAQSLRLDGCLYDVQVELDDGTTRTPEVGVWSATPASTTSPA